MFTIETMNENRQVLVLNTVVYNDKERHFYIIYCRNPTESEPIPVLRTTPAFRNSL